MQRRVQHRRFLTSLIMSMAVAAGASAQTASSLCGKTTPEGTEFVKALLYSGTWERWANTPLPGPPRSHDMDLPKTFVKITVHPVRFYTGAQGVDIDAVDFGIALLNESVADTGLTFYRHEVRTLDDDNFALFHLGDAGQPGEMGALIATDNVPGTMNIYYVPYFFSANDWVGGVSTLPYGQPPFGIVLPNDNAAGDVLTHEVGHYNGLYHTHDWQSHGDECTQGTDCRFQGDLICETPADPGAGGWSNFTENGYCSCGEGYSHAFDFTACEMTDENGNYDNIDCDDVGADCEGACDDDDVDDPYFHAYQPMGNNVMAYYGCGEQEFVSEQLSIFLSVVNTIHDDHKVTDTDCNGNDIPDQFEIASPIHEAEDCDGNGRVDSCDIHLIPALDCDENGRLDSCQVADNPALVDCNGNGALDYCELVDDPTLDCNFDGEFDACELNSGEETDCNDNGIPDSCDVVSDASLDCDGDGILDLCAIQDGDVSDCNGNDIPDVCDLENDPSLDCDGDGLTDACQIEADSDLDCDGNGQLDTCELAEGGASVDCDGDGLIDSCAIADGLVVDCDTNDVPDSCEDSLPDDVVAVVDLDGDPLSHLGQAVAIDGDLMAVGIPGDDLPTANAGSVQLWRITQAGWTFEDLLQSDTPGSYDRLGSSVAISGDVVLAGSPRNNVMGSDSGSASIFRKVAGTWSEEAMLYADDGDFDDQFGASVLLHGDHALVSAPYAHGTGEWWTGAVYVYVDDGTDWTLVDKLTPPDGNNEDWFGFSMAASDDLLVIGAPGGDAAGVHAGAVYVYRLSGEAWLHETTFTSPFMGAHDHFGAALAIEDDTVVVGAPGTGPAGQAGAGAVTVYTHDGSTWSSPMDLTASDAKAGDAFGSTVALGENRLLVGAPHDDWGNNGVPLLPDQGAIYVFLGDGQGNWIEDAVIGPPDLGGWGSVMNYGASMSMVAGRVIAGAPGWSATQGDQVGAAIITDFRDCDGDGSLDGCQVVDDPSLDCDEDGELDSCAIGLGLVEDCDGNGVPDSCDIANGGDANGDGVLDACEGSGTPPGDCRLGLSDLLNMMQVWGGSAAESDYDGDGQVGLGDLIILANNWGSCL